MIGRRGLSRQSSESSAGYTMLEMIAVIMIIGIVGATFATRWDSNATYTISAQADLLARYLRHAQLLAMNLDVAAPASALRLSISANSYSLTCAASTGAGTLCATNGATVRDPAGNQLLTETLDYSVTLSGTNLDFDSWGRPVSGGALLSTARTFTLTGGGKTYSVTVSPITGFVTITHT